MENKPISAFAFKTAEQIEEIIQKETNNLKEQNTLLEAKILTWYVKTKDEDFANFFGITKQSWKS